MREVEVAHIGRQLVGKLAIGQPAVAVLGPPPPGAEMHFIDRDRRVAGIAAGRRRRRTLYRLRVDDDRCRLRAHLGGKRHRIGLERQQLAVGAQDLELVLVAGGDRRHEDFPEAVAAHAHGVAPAVPVIEIADDAHAPRIRRKHREGDAGDAVVHDRMRAELVVELKMRALAQEVEIEIGQNRRKAIRVFQLDDRLAKADAQAIRAGIIRTPAGEQSGLVNALQRVFVAAAAQIAVTCAAHPEERPERPERRPRHGGRGSGTGRRGDLRSRRRASGART